MPCRGGGGGKLIYLHSDSVSRFNRRSRHENIFRKAKPPGRRADLVEETTADGAVGKTSDERTD